MTENQMTNLRIELARRNMKQIDLAKLICCPPSTLSSWLRQVAPPPEDLSTRIEIALCLPKGALAEGRNL